MNTRYKVNIRNNTVKKLYVNRETFRLSYKNELNLFIDNIEKYYNFISILNNNYNSKYRNYQSLINRNNIKRYGHKIPHGLNYLVAMRVINQ